MKKVALLLLIAFVGSSVMFAVPAVNAVSDEAADEADLFAAVGGEELSVEEAEAVEGAGWPNQQRFRNGNHVGNQARGQAQTRITDTTRGNSIRNTTADTSSQSAQATLKSNGYIQSTSKGATNYTKGSVRYSFYNGNHGPSAVRFNGNVKTGKIRFTE